MSDAAPLYFGTSARPLFGWLHVPVQPHGDLGVVICNPFGYEAVCAHRSIREFAQQAALARLPALRFDYDGTGDSAGEPLDDHRLAAWVSSTQHAVDALRRHSGVQRVALLGIRLGATIAALAAQKCTDIAALIAIVPVVKAKAYLRELRMLQLAMDNQRGIERTGSDDLLESCGFMLGHPAQSELKVVDLAQLGGPVPPDVLIIERVGSSADDQWPAALRQRGASVERCELEGYTEMMLDSHKSVVPQDMIDKAIRWLGTLKTASAATSAQHPPAAEQSRTIDASGVTETAVRFGSRRHLFGIVSSMPVSGSAARRAILLLTAGAVHHIGPNRSYVSLARHWARRGHLVLRMDIGGTGDSAPRAGSLEQIVYSPEVVDDVAAALTFLQEQWGAARFDAVGICSGAYHALKAASAALPLTSITLINPLTFRWREGLSLAYPEHRVSADIARYRTNVFRPSSWLKLLRGGVDLGQLTQVLLRRAVGYGAELASFAAHVLRLPLRDDLGVELAKIAARGVGLQFVFATEEPGIELLHAKGGYALRRLRAEGRVRIDLIAGADHTFTDRAQREQLLELLAERLDGPARAAAPS